MKSVVTSIQTGVLNMRTLVILLILAVVWLLVGCAGPKEVVVSQNKIQLLEIPRNLVAKCVVTPPPYSPDSFAALSRDKREDVLSAYSVTLLGDIAKCDNQIREIVAFEVREKKKIEDTQNGAPK